MRQAPDIALVFSSRRRQRERSADCIPKLSSMRPKDSKISFPKTNAKRRKELLLISKQLAK